MVVRRNFIAFMALGKFSCSSVKNKIFNCKFDKFDEIIFIIRMYEVNYLLFLIYNDFIRYDISSI